MYASLCDFDCIASLLPFVLGSGLSFIVCLFGILFSACYHWWICFLVWFQSSFFFFLSLFFLLLNFLNNFKNFLFDNFILFYLFIFSFFFSPFSSEPCG